MSLGFHIMFGSNPYAYLRLFHPDLQVKGVACPEFFSTQLLITVPKVRWQPVQLPTPLSTHTDMPCVQLEPAQRSEASVYCYEGLSMNSMP